MIECLCRYVSDGRVIQLVEDIILSTGTEALPPGSPLSSVLADVYLVEVDRCLDRDRMIRYCDNILGFSRDSRGADADITDITAALSRIGLTPNKDRIRVVPLSMPAGVTFDHGSLIEL
jgi:hypothetical protein